MDLRVGLPPHCSRSRRRLEFVMSQDQIGAWPEDPNGPGDRDHCDGLAWWPPWLEEWA